MEGREQVRGVSWCPEHIGSYRLLEKLGLLLRVSICGLLSRGITCSGFPRKESHLLEASVSDRIEADRNLLQ